jgi:CRP/FNR family cyclic AMP-dependent transcriptional regulator
MLTVQGEPTNDLFLIVHGEVEIAVNGRRVATRGAGLHVSEMALVDPQATRSATATAIVPTAALRISEERFSRLGKRNSDVWRRIATEMAKRLRERGTFLTAPHTQPVVFIGSATEGAAVMDAVEQYFKRKNVVPRSWTNGVFEASSTAIESLIALTKLADFAILLLTAGDITVSRGRKKASPRDNVVFELGLLMGALGRKRVIVLKPKNVDMRRPSDLLGMTWLTDMRGGRGTLLTTVKPACECVMRRIQELGPR